jgi:protein-tyrosine kinase
MSAVVELIPRTLKEDVSEDFSIAVPREEQAAAKSGEWNLAAFAEDQIRGLVQQIFLSGRKHARQVVFSAVDEETDVASLCLSVAQALVRQDSGNACVVEAVPYSSVERPPGDDDVVRSNSQKRFGILRDRAQQLSSCLWFMPRGALLEDNDSKFSPLWLRGRLAELRLEFDFTVLQGPAAGVHREAALLGNLCDGLVLVIRANATRRVAAQRAKQMLHAANSRLLGTVLSERSFPIPEALYKRL